MPSPHPPRPQPQHTPGPWGIEQTSESNWVGPLRADGKPDPVVFHNDREGLTDEALATHDADARLVAAAPDLLAACQAAHGFIANMRVPQNVADAGWQLLRGSKVLKSLETAIAKATEGTK